MSIWIGNTEITQTGKIKIGNTKEVWVRNTKVWPAGTSLVWVSIYLKTNLTKEAIVSITIDNQAWVLGGSANCVKSNRQETT